MHFIVPVLGTISVVRIQFVYTAVHSVYGRINSQNKKIVFALNMQCIIVLCRVYLSIL